MSPLLTCLLVASLAHAGDKDRDGIRGRRDACPEEPEVVNGYRDGDGCPDALGRVTVTVLDLDGQPIDGAHVRLGDERATAGPDGTVVFADRMPETIVELTAEKDGYVATTFPDWEIPEGEATEVVVLDWVPASIRVTVVDATSHAPLDAAVRWDGPGHIPSEHTGDDGEVVFSVRPGTWRVRVEADHYQAAEARVEVARDGAPDQRFALQPDWTRIETRWIPFEPGSTAISEAVRADLDDLAADLFAFPEVALTLQGHADSDDDTLSLRRAEAVRDALVAAGIDPGRLEVRDLGDRAPFDTPWTPEGRAANRAVRFRFVDDGDAGDLLSGVSVPFPGDRADLPPDHSSLLAPVIAALTEHPDAAVEIEGHRDRSEGALSYERASAVRDALIARGVDGKRLFAVGLRAVDGLDGGVAFRLRSGDEITELPHEVYFEPGTARVEAVSVAVLRDVARIVTKHPALRIAVRGHAADDDLDRAGRRARDRAAEVARFLRSEGVAPARLVERGFPTVGAEDDVRSRRVDFRVLPPPLLSTERIRFGPGSADLDDTAAPTLRRVADTMARHPAIRVAIHGTGVEADGELKETLGTLRASRVRDRLLDLGVPAGRLIVDGDPGDTDAGEVRFSVADVHLDETIAFQPRSSDLDASARAALDALVPTLLLVDGAVRIVGVAGGGDGRVVLEDLATARADAVADYLACAGIPRGRLRIRSQVEASTGATARRAEIHTGRP